jgi:hypothetical protein
MSENTPDADFIFYADESGDHSLTSIDRSYPLFALSLCAFKKDIYCRRVVPNFQRLKFRYFGHDAVVLHEHDIRKQKGDFRILTDAHLRENFLNDLSACLEAAPFTIFSTVILKPELKLELFPENPYVISLRICLQQVHRFLARRGQTGKRTYFIFEKRGKKEDTELELEFRRIVGGQNDHAAPFEGFNIHFSDKRMNSTGMQIADLTARPLGLSVARPGQPNRAFELIQRKIYRHRQYSRPSRGIYIP